MKTNDVQWQWTGVGTALRAAADAKTPVRGREARQGSRRSRHDGDMRRSRS